MERFGDGEGRDQRYFVPLYTFPGAGSIPGGALRDALVALMPAARLPIGVYGRYDGSVQGNERGCGFSATTCLGGLTELLGGAILVVVDARECALSIID